jgi:hypothetical protein
VMEYSIWNTPSHRMKYFAGSSITPRLELLPIPAASSHEPGVIQASGFLCG